MTSVGRRVRGHLTPLFCLSLALAAPALLATGCGGAPPSSAAGVAPEAAPYPFTVYQIRAGCASGRTIEYRMEKAGEEPKTERWLFADVDPETVKITTTDFDASGKPLGEPTTESAKWTALHEHAHFPFAATVITSEPITLPVGTFDSMRYVVTKGDEVKTYWFARSLPGPPVKVEVTKGGTTVMTMTMEANLAKAR